TVWRTLSSVVLAVWIVAVTNADPTETRELGPIPIDYSGRRQGLLIISDLPTAGVVTVRAPLSVWEQIGSDNVRLAVDLEGLEDGTHELAVEPSVDVKPAQISEWDPGSVSLTLERAATASLDIDVVAVGEPQLGYRTISVVPTPERAIILGPLSQVDRVVSVLATVNVAERREDFEQGVPLSAVDSDGNVVEAVELDPEVAQISVAIEPRERFRLVSVVPNLEGEEQLAEGGYRLTDVSVTPEVITVFSSDPTALQGLPGFVLTSPFDLSGATGDLERRLSLDLPQGVSPVEDQGVLVKVSISPVEGTITVSRLVEVRALTDGLYAQLSPEGVDIILNGPLPTLNSLQLEDVRVILDLIDLGLGIHQVSPLVIIAPTDVEHEPVFPSTIAVTITANPPPTPIPPP
ncbi:MAG: YbbR-like domain-containing protein, partial [Anaerolineales bacterium]